MYYKIVFFDIDGTLVDEGNNMPQSTVDAVEKIRKKGMKVVLATGRAPVHIRKVAKKLNISSYICCNGSIVRYEGEKLYSESIEEETVYEIAKNANEKNHPLIKFTENNCIANVEFDHKIKSTYKVLLDTKPIVQPNFYDKEDVYQLYLYCNEGEQRIYERKHPQLKFTRWYPYTVDISDKTMNKSVGIERVLHHLNIRKEEAIAFGDNLNDLEMLSYVGVGVAMGNAVEEAKKKADFVTKPLYEDGIHYALEKLQVI